MVIDALRNRYLLKDLLVILNMAKSSYCYQEAVLRKTDKYAQLRIDIQSIISEKVVRRIMQEEGLIVFQKRRRKYSSYKGEISPEVENLLKRNFHAHKPNSKWLTDITEFSIPAGKIYLSTIINCFDGTIA